MDALSQFVAARSELRRRAVRARAEELGRLERDGGPDDASMLEDDLELIGQDVMPSSFHCVYSSAAGVLSERCITIRRVELIVNDIKLIVYCHLRRATRTLLASRIIQLIDLNTGEVFDEAANYCRDHFLNDGAPTGFGPEALAIGRCKDELVLLTVLAAVDGTVCENEEDLLVAHVFDRWDDPLDEGEVRRRLRAIVPDEAAFNSALNHLSKGRGDLATLRRSVRRLVDADGVLDPKEVSFVVALQEHLECLRPS